MILQTLHLQYQSLLLTPQLVILPDNLLNLSLLLMRSPPLLCNDLLQFHLLELLSLHLLPEHVHLSLLIPQVLLQLRIVLL